MKITNELQPLLSVPAMSKGEQTREALLMRRMYRTERRLTRQIERHGPRRFLREAIAIARRRGDEARNRIIAANVRLAAWWAKKYADGPIPVTFDELVSAGCVRMVVVLKRFNPAKGALSTFLGFHFRSVYARATGRQPSKWQIAERRLVSLDAENTPQLAAPEEDVDQREMAEHRLRIVEGCLPHLKDQDRDVLRRRYGLDGRGGRLLEHLGHELGVSSERCRQIEARAVGLLRRHVERPLPLWVDAGAPVVTDRRTSEFTIAPRMIAGLNGR